MSDKSDAPTKPVNVSSNVRVVPFTGLFFAVWAFFSPAGYGAWLGHIVSAFRSAAGF